MSLTSIPADSNQGGGNSANPSPTENGDRGPLRHFLIGSPQRWRATIRHLQARRYIDWTEWTQWTQSMSIKAEGLLIRPTAQEMYTHLEIPRRD